MAKRKAGELAKRGGDRSNLATTRLPDVGISVDAVTCRGMIVVDDRRSDEDALAAFLRVTVVLDAPGRHEAPGSAYVEREWCSKSIGGPERKGAQ